MHTHNLRCAYELRCPHCGWTPAEQDKFSQDRADLLAALRVAITKERDMLLAALRDVLAFFREFDGPATFDEINHPALDRANSIIAAVEESRA